MWLIQCWSTNLYFQSSGSGNKQKGIDVLLILQTFVVFWLILLFDIFFASILFFLIVVIILLFIVPYHNYCDFTLLSRGSSENSIFLLLQGRGKFCVHTILLGLHLWDYTEFVIVIRGQIHFWLFFLSEVNEDISIDK